jgi:hypothetical protein
MINYANTYARWNADPLYALPRFNYTKIRPLTALFTRCPVCGGTTTLKVTAYCGSCGSQWHPVSLQPITQADGMGLHEFDRLY